MDFFALPLASYNAVLGMQWFATLGPILWDFGALTMSFWRSGHQVCWHSVAGLASPGLCSCSGPDLLEALLANFAGLCVEPHRLSPPRYRDHSITLLPSQRWWSFVLIATRPRTRRS